MKSKKNARDKRAEAVQKQKALWSKSNEKGAAVPVSKVRNECASAEELARKQEEETRVFLDYLNQDVAVFKDESETEKVRAQRKKLIEVLNLEAGMPLVEEAINRLNLGLQEMRISGVKLVRLIHGYGSTGRGGKICIEARRELKLMKNKRRIQGYVTGEEFGPYSDESRKLVDQFPEIVRDHDYGRCNHGITIVIL